MFERMFHFYSMNRDEFLERYHRRSNVESVFSMVKAKLRDHVRSKTDNAMVNEVLCKLLAHNICCLIMSHFEVGIEPMFWGEQKVETVEAPEQEPVVVDVVPVAVPAAKVEAEPVRQYWTCAGA